MRGSSETIATSMFTPTVWIDARLETDIRAVVVRDQRCRRVAEKLCLRGGVVRFVPVWVAFERKMLESVRRILCGATTFHISLHKAEVARQLAVAQDVLKRYRNTLRQLAK